MSIYLSFYEKLKLIVVGMNGSVQTDNAYIREVTDVTTLMTVMMYQMRITASVTIRFVSLQSVFVKYSSTLPNASANSFINVF